MPIKRLRGGALWSTRGGYRAQEAGIRTAVCNTAADTGVTA